MNFDAFLLAEYNVDCEIYTDGGRMWVYIATDHASGGKYPVDDVPDIGRYVNQVLEDAVKEEKKRLEEE